MPKYLKTVALNHFKGLFSEIYIMLFLILKGYKIRHWRLKSKAGEIDIIARRGMTIVAIEVKYRKNTTYGFHAVSYKQKKRIKNTLMQYGAKYHNHILRCDICIVTPTLKITHIQNAF